MTGIKPNSAAARFRLRFIQHGPHTHSHTSYSLTNSHTHTHAHIHTYIHTYMHAYTCKSSHCQLVRGFSRRKTPEAKIENGSSGQGDAQWVTAESNSMAVRAPDGYVHIARWTLVAPSRPPAKNSLKVLRLISSWRSSSLIRGFLDGDR